MTEETILDLYTLAYMIIFFLMIVGCVYHLDIDFEDKDKE